MKIAPPNRPAVRQSETMFGYRLTMDLRTANQNMGRKP
jgi:hypothetical protein